MHWNIFYDRALGYVRASQRGDFSTGEEGAFLDEIFEAPFWEPGLPLLIDYSSIPMEPISNRELESTSKQLSEHREQLGKSRLALLCRTDVQFGLGRQFQMISMGRIDGEMRIFRDEDAAVEWLLEN